MNVFKIFIILSFYFTIVLSQQIRYIDEVFDGVNITDARKAMTLAAAKLPIKCKFVERNI